MIKLRTKLYLSYIAIIVIFSLVIVGFINIILRDQFASFAKDKISSKNNEIVNDISKQYTQKNQWNTVLIETIGMKALESGMLVKVKDVNGSVVWDARSHNSGLCTTMIKSMSENMSDLYLNWDGEYVENEFDIYVENEKIGLIEIGYIGPYYFNDMDASFISNMNKIIYSLGGIFLIISVMIASFLAKNFLEPISEVINLTQSISKGDFKQKIQKKSNIYEFNNLANSINTLSNNLEEQKRLRKRLTEDIAHELRTPITNLQSHVEAMIDGIWEVDKNRLNSLLDESKRISRLIRNLEELEALESDEIKLNKSKIEVSKILESIIFSLGKDLKQKNVNIKYQIKENTIFADSDKISQVLINITRNAVKYSSNNGDVEIKVEKIENIIQIKIKDYGIGIKEEDINHIFERFYRGDKSRNRKTGGLGIGLSISKAIVEAHNGYILVNSKEGSGAEFIVGIPDEEV